MELALRIFTLSVSVFVFAMVFYKLVKHQLNESNSILWLLIGVMTLVAGIFPQITDWLAGLVGIDYPPSLLFLGSIIIIMLISFKNSMYISRNQEKISELATIMSILKEENKRLHSELAKMEKNRVRSYGPVQNLGNGDYVNSRNGSDNGDGGDINDKIEGEGD